MKAISTRYVGPTNTRGARIIADDGDRNRISIPYPHELNSDQAHLKAAVTLRNKMGWKGKLIGGGTKQGMCFVFAESTPRSNPARKLEPIISEDRTILSALVKTHGKRAVQRTLAQVRDNPRKRLTLEKVREELRPLGLSIRKRDDEYRVAYTISVSPYDRPGIEASAYYTTDLEDALNTGRAMAAHKRTLNPVRAGKRAKRQARALAKRYRGKARARAVAGGMIGTATTPAQREHFLKVKKALGRGPVKKRNPNGARRPSFVVEAKRRTYDPWRIIAASHVKSYADWIAKQLANHGLYAKVTD